MHIGHASGLMIGLVHPGVAHDEAILVDHGRLRSGAPQPHSASHQSLQLMMCGLDLVGGFWRGRPAGRLAGAGPSGKLPAKFIEQLSLHPPRRP